jgi:hypothetical protein
MEAIRAAKAEARKTIVRSKIDTTCVDNLANMNLIGGLGLGVAMVDPYALANDQIQKACAVVENEIALINKQIEDEIAKANADMPTGPFGPIKISGGMKIAPTKTKNGSFSIDKVFDGVKNDGFGFSPSDYKPPALWK